MSWSYDESDLSTDTTSGRLNSVRLLVGDTDTTDQQVQDEEIEFALSQTSNNIYYAAAWIAKTLASKYARRVDTQLDGALSAAYSQLHKHYQGLSEKLEGQGKTYGSSLGIKYGGVSETELETARQLTDRIKPSFTRDRFRNGTDSTNDYYTPDDF